MPETFLKAAAYGKDRVRLLKVYREGKWQTAVELTVRVMLEGDIETSYTRADNRCVSCRFVIVVRVLLWPQNTVYIIAKRSPNVNIIELFAQELSQHFLDTYAHIHKVQISIIKHKWTRILVSGSPHPHSFVRDGDDLQTTTLTQTRKGNAVTCTSGLQNLLVLKTTGSAFHSFIRDKYTTLPDVWDRIFSTSVDATWTFKHSDVKKFRAVPFDAVHAGVREITLDTFATDDSASVQATLFKMQQRILERYGDVEEVGYALPNKHYFGVDMSKFGIDNTNKKLDVYQPVADPSGYWTENEHRPDQGTHQSCLEILSHFAFPVDPTEPMAEPVDLNSTMTNLTVTRSGSFTKSLDVLNSYGSLTYRLRATSPTWTRTSYQLLDISRDQILWDADLTKAGGRSSLSFHQVALMGQSQPTKQAHYRSLNRGYTFEFGGGFFEWRKRATHEGGEEIICIGRVTNVYNEVSGPLLVARFYVAPSWGFGNSLGTLMMYDKRVGHSHFGSPFYTHIPLQVPKPMEDNYFAFREFLVFTCVVVILCFEQTR
ncbi:hypothetical protein BC936DRAFT_139130 [Jimgerdemannia flammicorona]|uniref:factor independent urate hydroxylase n=1 Tax=Jimgerdemannia flammicorona TaxID=994334 RepID=A0A433BAM0_9FUNG|nr:hypothetical protein BC936DRAFT_139130 [Jimgerdemannia flammicorona]